MRNYLLRMALFAGLAAALVVLCSQPTAAQDPNMPPTHGRVFLSEGFMPDPYDVSLIAGGPIVTTLGGVRAHVARAPDFRVNYMAGRSVLTFYATSPADTTLLINLPDGTWIADHNSGGTLNPMIRLPHPRSGQYDIWVGTVSPETAPAVLHITELR